MIYILRVCLCASQFEWFHLLCVLNFFIDCIFKQVICTIITFTTVTTHPLQHTHRQVIHYFNNNHKRNNRQHPGHCHLLRLNLSPVVLMLYSITPTMCHHYCHIHYTIHIHCRWHLRRPIILIITTIIIIVKVVA